MDKLTRVKVVYPDRPARAEDTSLVIKVPGGSSLAVNTVSADVRAQGVRGQQRLQSVSGDIRTEAAAEDVECKTVSGSVTVAGTGQRGLLTVTIRQLTAINYSSETVRNELEKLAANDSDETIRRESLATLDTPAQRNVRRHFNKVNQTSRRTILQEITEWEKGVARNSKSGIAPPPL